MTSITYGTSCPPNVPTGVVGNFGDVHFNRTNLECANPGAWFNPTRVDKGGFLGLCQAPPVVTLYLSLTYFVAFSFVYSFFGLYGVWKRNQAMMHSLAKYSKLGIQVNIAAFLLNAVAWVFVLIADSQYDQGLCTQMASLNFQLCSFTAGQTFYFFVFIILSFLIHRSAKKASTQSTQVFLGA
eukprot:TRINITY_DN501_c1_g3_i5.p1 TRINITY_DN501_c1_g3~~TRINITY_DN501_c1_g3_i5.p1  ORF type:complete len:183 (-),score=58.02 TRINITY_DN501_c1_g3_i5:165-713(-)